LFKYHLSLLYVGVQFIGLVLSKKISLIGLVY